MACAIASLGLSLAPTNDLRILKMVIFSRAVTSLVTHIGDATGLFRPLESDGHGAETRLFTTEYFLAVAGCFFLMSCYIMHPNSMVPALKRTIHRGMAMNKNEELGFDCLRALNELEPRLTATKNFPRWGG